MLKNSVFKKLLLVFVSIIGIALYKSYWNSYENTFNSTQGIEVIEVLNTNGVNNQGCLMVSGDIKNVSEYNVTNVEIIAIFYDNKKNEVAKATEVCENVLLPNNTYHFNISCLKKEGSSYDIQVVPTIEEKPKNFLDILFE